MASSKRAGRKSIKTLESMTGFGSGTVKTRRHSVTVELRSVNSRYFDCSVRLPLGINGDVEGSLKTRLEEALKRGRVEAFVTVQTPVTKRAEIVFDEELFLEAMNKIRASKKVSKIIESEDLAEILLARREIFDVVRVATSACANGEGAVEQVSAALFVQALQKALDQLTAMRRSEGARLGKDILSRLTEIESICGEIAKYAAKAPQRASDEMKRKIDLLIDSSKLDPKRLEQEIALLVSRSDIHEELVRLNSHVLEFRRLMASESAPGKRLEFLTQEFLRELNTIGSKITMAEAQHLVVTGKAVVEKIKEQIQNVV